MAYICYKTTPCDKCEHYRFDEEINRMACWAEHDEQMKRERHGKQMALTMGRTESEG